MKFDEFQDKVEMWSAQRGIYDHSDAKSQALKTVSEVGEMCDNLIKGRDITDDIGDIIVTILNVAFLSNIDMEDAFDKAWDDIKYRQGYMVEGGAFIKSDDQYEV